MKKIYISILLCTTMLFASNVNELTQKMIDTFKNNTHTEKKLDKPYVVKGYVERKLNLDIQKGKLYLFIKNLNDNKYIYIQFISKPGDNISIFNKARVKIKTTCSTIVNNAYYKDCK